MEQIEYNIDIEIEISIPILGDESLSKLSPPDGFVFENILFDEYEYKEKITDNSGNIQTDFYFALHNGNTKPYITTLKYKGSQIIKYNKHCNSLSFLLEDDFEQLICPIQSYFEEELHKYFSLIHLFKEGEVARKSTFYKFTKTNSIIKNEIKHTSTIADIVTVIRNPMIVTDDDIYSFNALVSCSGKAYLILKEIAIDDLEFTYHVLDNATNYKNIVAVLEVLLLKGEHGQKKKMLSNRIAVLLGVDNDTILQLYHKVRHIYSERSKATHDGKTENITNESVNELRDILRKVIIKYIDTINEELSKNSSLTFIDIKNTLIHKLKNIVEIKDREGIFPQDN